MTILKTIISLLPFSYTRRWYAQHYLSNENLDKSLQKLKNKRAKSSQFSFTVKPNRFEIWQLVWQLLFLIVIFTVVVASLFKLFYSLNITSEHEQSQRLVTAAFFVVLFFIFLNMLYAFFTALRFLILKPVLIVYKNGILLKMGNRKNFIRWKEIVSIKLDKWSSLVRGGPQSFVPVYTFIKIIYKKHGQKRVLFLCSRSENIFLFLLTAYYFNKDLQEDIYKMMKFIFGYENKTQQALKKVRELSGILTNLKNYKD